MRKFIASNAQIFQRLDRIEIKQIKHDNSFEKVFKALEIEIPKQGIFFNGQIFDAYKFVSDLIKKAKKEIILIDNYVNYSTLNLFCETNVDIVIYTSKITEKLKLDLEKYNSQYKPVVIKEFKESHDRFLIIDKKVYHFGASLKDLGKKWFAFSKFEKEFYEVIQRRIS